MESRTNPAAGRMIVRCFSMAATALCLGLALASCSSFSDTVADHWPRWAGGEPNDVPPRPGAPGYNQFIAHQQPSSAATKPANPAAVTNAQPASSNTAPRGDSSVVNGGLY
jgi:hypothetical protein